LPHTVKEDIKLEVTISTSYALTTIEGGRDPTKVVVRCQIQAGLAFKSSQVARCMSPSMKRIYT